MASQKSRRRAPAAGRAAVALLLSSLTFCPVAALDWTFGAQAPLANPDAPIPHAPGSYASAGQTAPGKHQFTLRHLVHRGGKKYPGLYKKLDVRPGEIAAAASGGDGAETGLGPYEAGSSSVLIPRLREREVDDIVPLLYAAQRHGETVSFPDESWTVDDVASPNITDRDTVINFSLMAGGAYNRDPTDPEWEYPKQTFNLSTDVGWERDGIRGHVFANEDNSTIVLSIKGTSSAVFDGAETTRNDKENDNLFAGCCCGQGEHYLWRQVCDCMTSAYTCNETCVTKAIRNPSRYYASSVELYGNVTEMYPDSAVWLTGHSLGGLVSGLLGLTFGLPVVTFEALPQALAAGRLGLPTPPGYRTAVHSRQDAGVWNFGHTADPVYMGTCNSASSVCTIAGYALQSQCHVGLRCEYDVVDEWKWRMSMTTHGIRGCIKDVYRAWEGAVPACEPDPECQDCFNWKRIHSNGSERTTTSSTSSTQTTLTRTETCKTPGWWGCLDPTSPVTTTATSTTTVTSATCKSRGWFGNCLDEVTTTFTSTTTIPPPPPTTTAAGRTSGPAASTGRSTSTSGATATATTTCSSPGYFWGCHDKSSDAPQTTITERPKHDMIL